jgi:anti-sigma factor RsiW
MVRSAHLKDDRLFECYVAAHAGEPLDPRLADHLSDCAECVARYNDLVAFMNDVRDDAEAEADEIFTPERLRVQQQQIARRLEQVHRSARVITFPGREPAGSRTAVRVTPRWLAAAAAAGLFVGVAVGGFLGPDHFRRTPVSSRMQVASSPAPAQAAGVQPVRVSATQVDTADDDQFMMELELALARPHARELQSFDAMTPHVRDGQ